MTDGIRNCYLATVYRQTGFLCFVHPIFRFWSLLATKLQKYYVIFVYFLHGQKGKTKKKNGKQITN